jgi:streptogramin lyase
MRLFIQLIVITAAFASLHAAQISTFAGSDAKGFSGDGGPATAAQLNQPFGITRGPDGALYICDTGNHRIRRVAPDGTISTVAGNGTRGWTGDGGPAIGASLNEPYEVRFDSAGNLFFVERMNHLVRRVDAKSGAISTIAGTGVAGFSGDGGPAVNARFNEPHSIGFDSEGDLYICDINNHRVRKVDMKSGLVSTFAGTGEKKPTPEGKFAFGDKVPLHGPRAIDFDRSGGLVLALREGNAVFDFGMTTRIVRRIAGNGKKGFTGDGGPALEATLAGPKGVSIGPDDAIYLADTENHAIRRIDARGTIERIAGTGTKGDGPDGDPLACKLARPHGVFVDKDGAVFIGDSENHRVRVVRP